MTSAESFLSKLPEEALLLIKYQPSTHLIFLVSLQEGVVNIFPMMHSRELMVGDPALSVHLLIHSFISAPGSSGLVNARDIEMNKTWSVRRRKRR